MNDKLYNIDNKKESELIEDIMKMKAPLFDLLKADSMKFRKKNFQTIAKEMTGIFGILHYASRIYHPYEYISFFLESIIMDRVLNLDFEEHRSFVLFCFTDYYLNGRNDDNGSWFRMRYYLQSKYNEINRINKTIKYKPYSREMLIKLFEEKIYASAERNTKMGFISIHLLKNGRKSRIIIKRNNDFIFDDSIYVYQNNSIYVSYLLNAYKIYLSTQ